MVFLLLLWSLLGLFWQFFFLYLKYWHVTRSCLSISFLTLYTFPGETHPLQSFNYNPSPEDPQIHIFDLDFVPWGLRPYISIAEPTSLLRWIRLKCQKYSHHLSFQIASPLEFPILGIWPRNQGAILDIFSSLSPPRPPITKSGPYLNMLRIRLRHLPALPHPALVHLHPFSIQMAQVIFLTNSALVT